MNPLRTPAPDSGVTATLIRTGSDSDSETRLVVCLIPLVPRSEEVGEVLVQEALPIGDEAEDEEAGDVIQVTMLIPMAMAPMPITIPDNPTPMLEKQRRI